jgi:AhpC/TSA family
LTDSIKDIVVLTTLVLAALMQQPAAAPAPPPPPPPAPPAPPALEVGAVAPNFSLPGATRFGTLKNPVRLSDYKGKTVVLAFFFRARTRG